MVEVPGGRDRTGNHAHQQPEAVEDLRRDHEPNRSLLRFRLTNTSTYGACCILRCAPGGLSSWTAAATAMAPNHGPLVEMGAWSGEETEGPRASIINGSCTQLKRIDLEKKKPFIFQLATGGKAFGKWMNIFKLIWKEIEYFKRVLGYLGNNVIFVFVEIKRLNGFLSLSISLKVCCVAVFLSFSHFSQLNYHKYELLHMFVHNFLRNHRDLIDSKLVITLYTIVNFHIVIIFLAACRAPPHSAPPHHEHHEQKHRTVKRFSGEIFQHGAGGCTLSRFPRSTRAQCVPLFLFTKMASKRGRGLGTPSSENIAQSGEIVGPGAYGGLPAA